MWSFLNIRSSHPDVSSEKGALKTKILPNSLKNIHGTVFNLIKFQAKDQQFSWKEILGCALFVECQQNATSKISHAFHGPGFSGSSFFTVKVFLGPGPRSGPRF